MIPALPHRSFSLLSFLGVAACVAFALAAFPEHAFERRLSYFGLPMKTRVLMSATGLALMHCRLGGALPAGFPHLRSMAPSATNLPHRRAEPGIMKLVAQSVVSTTNEGLRSPQLLHIMKAVDPNSADSRAAIETGASIEWTSGPYIARYGVYPR